MLSTLVQSHACRNEMLSEMQQGSSENGFFVSIDALTSSSCGIKRIANVVDGDETYSYNSHCFAALSRKSDARKQEQ